MAAFSDEQSDFFSSEIRNFLSREELDVISAYSPGFNRKADLGNSPAVLAVDFTYSFVGLDAPISESVKKWPKSAGSTAWRAVRNAAKVIEEARKSNFPIYYTAAPGELKSTIGFGSKTRREGNDYGAITVVQELAPRPEDHVIRKIYPSGFFGTNLVSQLVRDRVDTLLVMGGTTSGCVRATVVDASSYHFHIGVISDAVFDRINISNVVNLFDMKLKYADLLNTSSAVDYLKQCTSSFARQKSD